jgi:hypothetical protein
MTKTKTITVKSVERKALYCFHGIEPNIIEIVVVYLVTRVLNYYSPDEFAIEIVSIWISQTHIA